MAIEVEGGAQGYIVTDPERLAQLAQEAIAERQRRMSGVYGGGRMVGWNNEGYRWADAHAQESGPVESAPEEDRYATRVLPASILYEGIDGDYPHELQYLAMRREPLLSVELAGSTDGSYAPPPTRRFWWEELPGSYEAPLPSVAEYETQILPVAEARKTRRERIRNLLAAERDEWKAEFQLWRYYIGSVKNLLKGPKQTAVVFEEAPTYRIDGDNNLIPLVADE